jgi:hypothetical protein
LKSWAPLRSRVSLRSWAPLSKWAQGYSLGFNSFLAIVVAVLFWQLQKMAQISSHRAKLLKGAQLFKGDPLFNGVSLFNRALLFKGTQLLKEP